MAINNNKTLLKTTTSKRPRGKTAAKSKNNSTANKNGTRTPIQKSIKKISIPTEYSNTEIKCTSNVESSINSITNSPHFNFTNHGITQSVDVVIVQEGNDKFTLLDNVLKKSLFWFALEESRFRLNLDKEKFKILIKPDFTACELLGSTATDPQLVEHLVDLLFERGYTQVVIAEGCNSFDLWLENRDVQILADVLGYQYVTLAGREYNIIDLAEEPVPGPFKEGSILQGTNLPRHWVDADFRILFSKNKTDDEDAYHLGLNNLISLLPLKDKDYHYKYRLKHEEVLIELLRHTTVNFSIIDAYVSNHGNAGNRVARPIETHTLIAGQNLLLTDHAAIIKMGADPNSSVIHSKALNEIGLPKLFNIDGDLKPYNNWINVHPMMLDSVRKRQQCIGLSQVLQPWIQTVDKGTFPFKDPVNEQINNLVSRYFVGIDDNPYVFWSLISLNYVLAYLYHVVESLQTLYWKDLIWQKEVYLNIDIDAYSLREYEAIGDYLEPYEARTRALKKDSNGLRWVFNEDGSVLFEFSRNLPIDYDDFVSQVDICKSIQYMNDYIGGLIIPVKKDPQGRVTHQVERNLYLPQPNYLVLYQGQNIDVSKLEYIQYTKDEQKMTWKTVKSENGSASYDDGTVRFVKTQNGDTLVSIFGRQQFTLPLFWQIVNLDNYPALKNSLFNYAYTTFFTNTLANFEAVYEGRNIRIGKAWNPLSGESNSENIGSPSAQIVSLLKRMQDYIQNNIPEKEGFLLSLFTAHNPEAERIDEDGFAHFKYTQQQTDDQTNWQGLQSMFSTNKTTAQGFWKSLYEAVLKDSGITNG